MAGNAARSDAVQRPARCALLASARLSTSGRRRLGPSRLLAIDERQRPLTLEDAEEKVERGKQQQRSCAERKKE
jgi:hypothetical protein